MREGDVLVTDMSESPTGSRLMKRAAAIVTNRRRDVPATRRSIARELGIPAVSVRRGDTSVEGRQIGHGIVREGWIPASYPRPGWKRR